MNHYNNNNSWTTAGTTIASVFSYMDGASLQMNKKANMNITTTPPPTTNHKDTEPRDDTKIKQPK